jgi:hypothetical protein
MSSNGSPPDPTGPELNRFQENRHCFPLEQLIPYEGRHVAWNLEGTAVVASGNSFDEVHQRVLDAGIPPNRVVFDYILPPDVSLLGGLCDSNIG